MCIRVGVEFYLFYFILFFLPSARMRNFFFPSRPHGRWLRPQGCMNASTWTQLAFERTRLGLHRCMHASVRMGRFTLEVTLKQILQYV
jgi:hypothetical protein